jgi:hypothetical protein
MWATALNLPNEPNPTSLRSLYLPFMQTNLSMDFTGVKSTKWYMSSVLDVNHEMARDLVVVYDTRNYEIQTVRAM